MIGRLSGWWKIIVRFLVDLIDRMRPDLHRVWHDAMGIYLERSGYVADRGTTSLSLDRPDLTWDVGVPQTSVVGVVGAVREGLRKKATEAIVPLDDGPLISASAGLVSDEIETSIEEHEDIEDVVDLGHVSPCAFPGWPTSASLLNIRYGSISQVANTPQGWE